MSIIHGRWQDVLPGTYDPATAVVITDPPFGLSGKTGRGAMADKGYQDDTPWTDHVTEVLDNLPAARYVIRGPGSGLLELERRPRRLCIEVSAFRPRGRTIAGVVVHLWLGWGVWGRLRIGYRRTVAEDVWHITNPYDDPGTPSKRGYSRGDHGGVTPYAAAWMAVQTWAEPEWTVLDPFAGVGRIGRACATRGIAYLGAEVSEAWAREANHRIGQVQLEMPA